MDTTTQLELVQRELRDTRAALNATVRERNELREQVARLTAAPAPMSPVEASRQYQLAVEHSRHADATVALDSYEDVEIAWEDLDAAFDQLVESIAASEAARWPDTLT